MSDSIITVADLDFYKITIKDENGNQRQVDLQEELRFDKQNAEEHFQTNSAKYIYWSSLLERLNFQLEKANAKLEQVEALLDETARNSITKPTKDSVTAWIQRQDSWQEAKDLVIRTKYMCNHVNRIVKAFEFRNSMLKQQGEQNRHDEGFGYGAGRHSSERSERQVGKEFEGR